MTLFVGTSGWSYGEWKQGFYPQGLPQRRFLEHYSSVLGACEINATFYRTQTPDTVARWAAQTPEGFGFAAKAHRMLTYTKSIAPTEQRRDALHDYLASLSALGSKLRVVLLQFPPFVERDDTALKELLGVLPDEPRFALEFRNPSWDAAEVREHVAGCGATVCWSETAGHAAAALPPGPLAYVRLRAERYSDESRDRLKGLLNEAAGGRDVYVFTKHKGAAPDDRFAGIGLSMWLASQAS